MRTNASQEHIELLQFVAALSLLLLLSTFERKTIPSFETFQ